MEFPHTRALLEQNNFVTEKFQCKTALWQRNCEQIEEVEMLR